MAVIYVIDKNKKPLSPTNEVRATELLRNNRAVVHRISPLVIRLKERKINEDEYIIKIDPGSKTTGMAIVKDNKVYEFIELIHRGALIKKLMMSRKNIRRARRNRKTRYRKPRFLNRKRKEGWLPPSVKSRADNVVNIVKKFQKFIPIKGVMLEAVSFDTAEMSEGRKLTKDEYIKGPLYQKNSEMQ